MKVELAYGREGLVVDVPDDAFVVETVDLPGLADPAAAILGGLRQPISGPPLAAYVGPQSRVSVVFPDLTRPMPNQVVLPPVLAELDRLGVSHEQITLLCATGSHRAATADEMSALVGTDVARSYRIVDHQATDPGLVEVGRIDGTPVLLEPAYVYADVRIVTGFVEPHFFAGFSGGPKAVCPGLAGLETILAAHSPRRIAASDATWLLRHGNPVHDFIRAATALAPPTLAVDVTINRRREVTGVFVGQLPGGHDEACAFVEQTAVRSVPRPFDVVVTTNSGFPLDRNLYQSTKGLAAAARAVRAGGTIVMASACEDGLPRNDGFDRVLRQARTPAELTDAGRRGELDLWAAQVLGRVLQHARVELLAAGLDDDEIRLAQIHPIDDVSEAVARACARSGPGATVCVLPEGPQTVVSVGESS
jgi:nickel-dependent lactate racemase